ncbi:MAG: metallophosphoesterase [Ligilactobacillus sp.]|nr:metallophosphoesterase [Ligilactobacillus sp.]
MRYLVVSDCHYDRDILVKLRDYYRGKVDAMFYCGDSELASDDELWQDFAVVTGNCDYDPGYDKVVEYRHGDDRILMTHGHLYQVNFGLNHLEELAHEKGANLVFFGHTHQLGVQKLNGVIYLNPGSISYPRGAYANLQGTYAIVDTSDQAIDVTYHTRDFAPVAKLQAHFLK